MSTAKTDLALGRTAREAAAVCDVASEPVPQFCRVGGGQIDFVAGAVDGEYDGLLGYFTGRSSISWTSTFRPRGFCSFSGSHVDPPDEPLVLVRSCPDHAPAAPRPLLPCDGE
jgi:hypothetical protein